MLNLAGIAVILSVMYCFSAARQAINFKLVGKALVLQFILAFIILKFSYGRLAIERLSEFVTLILGYGQYGLKFVFGGLVDSAGPAGFLFIVQVLGNIIFFGALVGALSYLGIISFIVEKIGVVVGKVIGTSKVESFVGVANMFLGQTESPILVSRYLKIMTKSEIMLVLIAGMGSMSVSIIGGYTALGIPMQFLIIASALVPLGSIITGKILLPELEKKGKIDNIKIDSRGNNTNLIEAIANGAMDGIHMVIAISASLIAIIAIVAMINAGLTNFGLSLEMIFAWIFSPLAFLMGLDTNHIMFAGKLLGSKLVLNEFVAFESLGKVINELDYRTALMLSVSMSGFANIGSMGISVSAISVLCPEKKSLLSGMVAKAMLGGFAVSVLNAMILGIILMI